MITSHLMCANFFMIKMQGSSSSEIVGGQGLEKMSATTVGERIKF